MKKLLKNEICGSVKHKKSNISAKKKKTEETQNVRLGSANALPKLTLSSAQVEGGS